MKFSSENREKKSQEFPFVEVRKRRPRSLPHGVQEKVFQACPGPSHRYRKGVSGLD